MIKVKIMEEELNYVALTFKTQGTSTHEKPNEMEVIYDVVKTEEQERNTSSVVPEKQKMELIYDVVKTEEQERKTKNGKKAQLCTGLHLVAAGSGILCVILLFGVTALGIYLNTVMSELSSENIKLTGRERQLERKAEELTRERDRLNWTIEAILEYDNFRVNAYCPQKVCKPCLDGWVQFQSNCYLFSKADYYSRKVWKKGLDECRQTNANLVVIDSQEEQEFISNHTIYSSEYQGYWIGLSNKNPVNTWMWVDGSNITVSFWKTEEDRKDSCALSLNHADSLAKWDKVTCDSWNPWICETRAVIKPD
uniref:C-type lectin domain-containing protein n=1 Tax=Mastacembelus armatus TaxID=205130 RepID=A0A3Q3M118_9TELE